MPSVQCSIHAAQFLAVLPVAAPQSLRALPSGTLNEHGNGNGPILVDMQIFKRLVCCSIPGTTEVEGMLG